MLLNQSISFAALCVLVHVIHIYIFSSQKGLKSSRKHTLSLFPIQVFCVCSPQRDMYLRAKKQQHPHTPAVWTQKEARDVGRQDRGIASTPSGTLRCYTPVRSFI